MIQTTLPNPVGQATAVCPNCGRPVPVVPRQSAFCPHCGRRLRAGRRRRWPAVAALLFLGLAGAVVVGTWRSADPAPEVATVVAVAPVPDPAAAMLDDAQAVRAARLSELDRRSGDVRAAHQALVDQMADLSNLSARVRTAVARAADEDRWPTVVAGHPLQPGDGEAALARIAGVIDAERPAADRDAAALDGLTAAAAVVRGEADVIRQLRSELEGNPSPDRRAAIDRQAVVYRDRNDHRPDAAGLAADPTRPVDADALLR